jgi:hypothetical protein
MGGRGGDIGKLSVDAALEPGCQKCKRLDETLYVRIRALFRRHFELGGNFWIAKSEGAAEPAQVGQFIVVILEQRLVVVSVHVRGRVMRAKRYPSTSISLADESSAKGKYTGSITFPIIKFA